MPWFKFDKDYDYKPNPKNGSLVAYKAGMHLNIPEPAAKAAEEAKAGERSKHAPKAGDRTDGTEAVRPFANTVGVFTEEDLGESEAPAGLAATTGTPAGTTASAT